MKKTYGQFSQDKPAGMLRPFSSPQLMLMDSETPDGRLFESSGGSTRELPRTLYAQFAKSSGHDGAVPIGSLQEVTLNDDGTVTGRGWLTDLSHVRDTFVPLIASKTLFHNSVDLADVDVEIRWKSDDPSSPDFWEYSLVFTKWALAGSTLVGVPAFADARVLLDDEVTAALIAGDSELEINFGETSFHLEGFDEEITASDAPTAPWADFHMPEASTHTPITVDENGRVYGHLALWGECHGGIEDRCVLAPRVSSYASFNASNVLTERGMARTGPIFFLGGHPDTPLDRSQVAKAYGGVENSWCDVHVTDGQLGPWVSGRTRPGLAANSLYAARASRISGHWKGGQLAAVVSVNVPAFNVPGSELSFDHDGVVIRDGEIVELVASLRVAPPVEAENVEEQEIAAAAVTALRSGELSGADLNAAVAARRAQAAALAADTPDETDDEAALLAIELDLDDLEVDA